MAGMSILMEAERDSFRLARLSHDPCIKNGHWLKFTNPPLQCSQDPATLIQDARQTVDRATINQTNQE